MFNMSTCSLKFNSEECSAFIKVLDFTVINATLINKRLVFLPNEVFCMVILFVCSYASFCYFQNTQRYTNGKSGNFVFVILKGILGSALLAILLCEVIRYTLAQVYPQGDFNSLGDDFVSPIVDGIYYRFLLFCVFAIYFLSIRPERAPGGNCWLPKTAWQLKRHCETNTQTCSWTLLFMMSGIFRGSMM